MAGLFRPMAAGRRHEIKPRKAKRPRRAKVLIAVTIVLAVIVVGDGGFRLVRFIEHYSETCSNSGPTVVLHANGECVGVTDGSFKFSPALNDVENKILAENQWVQGTGENYETVAYLLPVSASGRGDEPITSVAEQLEGAYTAQDYANHHNVQGTAPLIQLLIASGGTQADGYATADSILESDVGSQHLVAVAGIGISLDTTIAEVKALTGAGIPAIGGTITSDAFDNIPNLVRVAPSNAQEVHAALEYIKPMAHTAMLIEDVNQTDSYDTTIVSEFASGFPDGTHRIITTESYNTTGDVDPNGVVAQQVANRIGQMTSDICVAHPGVVLFAGRGRELAILLSDLDNRPCDFPVTVLTGDDVTDMQITPSVRNALSDDVTVDYAGEANLTEWDQPQSGSAYKGVPLSVVQQGEQGFGQFRAAFTGHFPLASAEDSNAMMGYDATLASITVIRLAGVNAGTAAVIQELNAIQGSRIVLGASGPILFSAVYQGRGATGSNPVGKVIPILQLSPSGVPEFLKLER
jgi:hypothetical protein